MRSIAAALVLWLVSSAPAAELRTVRDVPYAGTRSDRQTLDLYVPTEGTGHPVVVWIHGGGWRAGSKSAVQRKPAAFVERGYLFVAINYRFVPAVTVQQMTADVAQAIRWVHDHAEEHGGDPRTIFVMGHSAGAHLAALVCTNERFLKAENLELTSLAGCVPVDTAAYDVVGQIESLPAARAAVYEGAFGDATSQRELSPIAHVAADKGIPPFLILHVADRVDSRMQSELFARRLAKAGISAKVVAAAGKTHGTINQDLGETDDVPTKAVFDFLSRVAAERGASQNAPRE